MAKIFIKTLSPIIQAAGNYAFILYTGKRFKYTINVFKDEKYSSKQNNEIGKKRSKKVKI